MEKVRPWCGQPSDRGRLNHTTVLLAPCNGPCGLRESFLFFLMGVSWWMFLLVLAHPGWSRTKGRWTAAPWVSIPVLVHHEPATMFSRWPCIADTGRLVFIQWRSRQPQPPSFVHVITVAAAECYNQPQPQFSVYCKTWIFRVPSTELYPRRISTFPGCDDMRYSRRNVNNHFCSANQFNLLHKFQICFWNWQLHARNDIKSA